MHQSFLTGILETARRLGYSTIVCASKKSEEEYKSLMMMLRHHVDGVLWEPLSDSDPPVRDGAGKKAAFRCSRWGRGSAHSVESVSFDYQRAGYLAMEALMKCKHRHVLCLTDFGRRGGSATASAPGASSACSTTGTPVDGLIHRAMDADEPGELVPFTVTGVVVCSSAGAAARVLEEAGRTNRRIPKYLSVVCLDDAAEGESRLPGVTSVSLPYGELARRGCAGGWFPPSRHTGEEAVRRRPTA